MTENLGIELREEADQICVLIAGKVMNIMDASDDFILAECDLSDLKGVLAAPFPKNLEIEVHSQDGFGTYFFHDLEISCDTNGLALDFICHTPNKYWEGRFGLAVTLTAINQQISHFDNLKVIQIETEDDWKGITVRRILSFGGSIELGILDAAIELKRLINTAEIALGGIEWKLEYQANEEIFCCEILLPLLRRMGFAFVRYTHGTKEYGKDFTFSEITAFGNYRHYALQAKAGSISGGVNSQVDELIGQLNDAFSMPFYELGSDERRYISTFIIAISGNFTENAREKIVEKMPKGLVGSVYFLDKHRIMELIERYWKVE